MVAIRRKDRQVSDEEAMAYLKAAEYGVLSTVGPDGEPYGVPLTYAVEEDGKGLVFHCARDGYKLACFGANPRAHFVAVQETNVLPEEFSIEYKSVMVSGLLEERTAKRKSAVRRLWATNIPPSARKSTPTAPPTRSGCSA